MYNAEVLSKFPVVQHFPFGSLFSWDRDPNAEPPPPSTHTSSQPMRSTPATSQETDGSVRGETQEEMRAPWATTTHLPAPTPQTATPWATRLSAMTSTPTTRTKATELSQNSREQPLRAPWANRGSPVPPPATVGGTQAPWAITESATSKSNSNANIPTEAPWAKKPELDGGLV